MDASTSIIAQQLLELEGAGETGSAWLSLMQTLWARLRGPGYSRRALRLPVLGAVTALIGDKGYIFALRDMSRIGLSICTPANDLLIKDQIVRLEELSTASGERLTCPTVASVCWLRRGNLEHLVGLQILATDYETFDRIYRSHYRRFLELLKDGIVSNAN